MTTAAYYQSVRDRWLAGIEPQEGLLAGAPSEAARKYAVAIIFNLNMREFNIAIKESNR